MGVCVTVQLGSPNPSLPRCRFLGCHVTLRYVALPDRLRGALRDSRKNGWEGLTIRTLTTSRGFFLGVNKPTMRNTETPTSSYMLKDLPERN